MDRLIVLCKCTEGNITKADGYVLKINLITLHLCYLTYQYYWLLMQTTRLYWFLTVPLTTIPSFRRESSHRLQFYTVSSSELLYALCSTRYCVGGYGHKGAQRQYSIAQGMRDGWIFKATILEYLVSPFDLIFFLPYKKGFDIPLISVYEIHLIIFYSINWVVMHTANTKFHLYLPSFSWYQSKKMLKVESHLSLSLTNPSTMMNAYQFYFIYL